MAGDRMGVAEFIAALNDGNLRKPGLQVIGLTKASEKKDEILFSLGADCGGWIALPAEMVAQVEVLDQVECDQHNHALVEVTLKNSSTIEGKVLVALLERFMSKGRSHEAMTSGEHLINRGASAQNFGRTFSACPPGQFALWDPQSRRYVCVPL